MTDREERFLAAVRKAGGKNINAEQTAAIMSDVNTVVCAGAGSGKTTVLSLRFLRLLFEGKAKADEILTLTFTRKAALEMSERIKSLVNSCSEISQENRELLSLASISTLDSFNSSIVRLDAARYGLARDFSVEDSLARDDKVRRLAASFMAENANRKECLALSRIFSPVTLISSFFAVIDANVVMCGNYDADAITQWLHSDIRGIYDKIKDRALSLLSFIAREGKEKNRDAALKLIECVSCDRAPDESAKFSKTGEKMAGEAVDEWRNELADRYEGLRSYLFSDGEDILQSALCKFATMLIEEKRRTSSLSFDDISHLAVDILKNNGNVRNYFKNRYKYIMIDEFQDNNSLQKDLLFLLSEKRELCNLNRIPSVDELESHKLFFVGDEKQSIYRFRGADVSVFRKLQDEITSHGGASLKLSKNYRSTPVLISHFNSIFERVFSSSDDDYKARFEETLPGRDIDSSSSVVLLTADRDSLDTSEKSANETEAEAVASLIYRMLSTDDFLIDGHRPCESDIALLFAKSSYQVAYELALKRRGIKYQVSVSKSLMQQAVSSDFYSLLQYALYDDDRIALASLLRSPFARVSDSGAAMILSGRNDALDDADRRNYEAFSVFMENVRDRLFTLTLSSLISYVYYEGGYYAYLQIDDNHKSFEEHYEYLFSYAVSYENAGLCFTDYLAFLRSSLGSRERLDEVSVLHEKREGVQIMTVHSAKGLEFPIVITASAALRDKPVEGSCVFSYKGRLVATQNRELAKILEEDARERAEAESRRLLYVALTRAERHLVVSGTYKKNRDGKLSPLNGSFFNSYLEAAGFDAESGSCSLAGMSVLDTAELASSQCAQVQDDHSSLAALEKAAATYVEKPFVSKPLTIRPSEIADGCENEESVMLEAFPSDFLYADEETSVFGTAIHSYLECTLCGMDTESVFSQEFFSSAQIRNDLVAMADNFLTSGFCRKIREYEYECEYRFFSYSSEHDAVWEGVMDLVVDMNDKILIVDYKSDRYKSENRHKAQIMTYIECAEKLFHKPCYGTLFYLREKSNSVIWDRNGNAVELDF